MLDGQAQRMTFEVASGRGFPAAISLFLVPSMALSPQLNHAAKSMGTVSLDTRKAHLVRHHGDLSAIYTWMNDERALVLVPTCRPGAPWFVVMESAAFSWDDSAQSNIPNVIRKTQTACNVLGIEPTAINCRRIASIVIDGLPDLIRMPSAPPVEYHKPSFGNLQLRADGQAVAAEEIRVEKEGATYGSV